MNSSHNVNPKINLFYSLNLEIDRIPVWIMWNLNYKIIILHVAGIREFHCKLCNYKGVTQSDLNRHMKSQIHMMKSQNACKHCGEGFVSPKNLERHYHEKHFSQYEQMATSHAVHAAKLS